MSTEPVTPPEIQPVATPAPCPGTVRDSAAPMTGRQKVWLAVRVILKRLRFFAILLAVGAFIGYWDTVKNYWDKWTRPQHVAVRQLEPGQEFFCPMHPHVIRSTYEPNGDVPKCPICGMPLSVRRAGEHESLPPGITGRVQFTPERVMLAGIRTVAVANRPIDKQTTTVGYIVFDESRLSRVVARVSGYVEKLCVDKTNGIVRKGEPLAEIYSPELFSTATELVIALKSGMSPELAAAARHRLKLYGVADQEIDAIEKGGKASPQLVVRSPQSGYVIDKKIVVGASVERGMTLLEVADLSMVWIEAEIYEKDIAFLRPDQLMEATVEACANRTFKGRLALVYPQLDVATRTNRVRFELPNPDGELRPGMFATVNIETPLETIEPFKSRMEAATQIVFTSKGAPSPSASFGFPVVPECAVIDTGVKKVVYVEREPGLFEGVEVQLGPRVGVVDNGRTVDCYPVIAGLQTGDRIAAAGSFLIDAETRLNPAAAATYFGASGGPQSSSRAGASGSTGGPRTAAPTAQGGPQPPAPEPSAEDLKMVAQLPEADRELALRQRWCPVTGKALGSMGVPYKITLRGQRVFLCCQGCAGQAKRESDKTLAKIRPGAIP